ncbi:YbfA family protein [Salmonella enterica]|nr:YbfA family protein [Salmonella enterica]EKN2618073.1 YbfA family protein [Salmonella enterica]EKY8824471.1 YbfA family protein [Salmonella enterica]
MTPALTEHLQWHCFTPEKGNFAVIAGVLALPVMLFWKDRARFYSYLHRVWSKTSDKPVWMAQAEKATCDFY